MRRTFHCRVVLLVAACCAVAGLRVPPVHALSQEEEIRIGREIRRDARRRLEFIEDPEIELYVDRIGRRILDAVGNTRYPYRFFVVEDPSTNAFAVPGGNIFVHSGLIQKVESTDELASVLAHEIVHVNARHFAALSAPDETVLLGMLGVFLAPVLGPAVLAAPALSMTRQLEFSRQMEEQADNLGVGYLARAGYDPQAAVDFMEKLYREKFLNPVGTPTYLMSHPLTEQRIANMTASIRALGLTRPRFRGADDVERLKLLIELRSEPNAAVERRKKAHEKDPEAAAPAYLLGVAYAATGRWRAARDLFERAVRLDPTLPSVHRDLGRAYSRTGEPSKAHAAFEAMLQREPDDPVTHLYRGHLFEKESRFRQAVRSYLRVRQLASFWPEAARRLGYAYRKLNQPGKAHYYLAQFHLLRDETGKAIGSLERAARQYPSDSPKQQVIEDEIAVLKASR